MTLETIGENRVLTYQSVNALNAAIEDSWKIVKPVE